MEKGNGEKKAEAVNGGDKKAEAVNGGDKKAEVEDGEKNAKTGGEEDAKFIGATKDYSKDEIAVDKEPRAENTRSVLDMKKVEPEVEDDATPVVIEKGDGKKKAEPVCFNKTVGEEAMFVDTTRDYSKQLRETSADTHWDCINNRARRVKTSLEDGPEDVDPVKPRIFWQLGKLLLREGRKDGEAVVELVWDEGRVLYALPAANIQGILSPDLEIYGFLPHRPPAPAPRHVRPRPSPGPSPPPVPISKGDKTNNNTEDDYSWEDFDWEQFKPTAKDLVEILLKVIENIKEQKEKEKEKEKKDTEKEEEKKDTEKEEEKKDTEKEEMHLGGEDRAILVDEVGDALELLQTEMLRMKLLQDDEAKSEMKLARQMQRQQEMREGKLAAELENIKDKEKVQQAKMDKEFAKFKERQDKNKKRMDEMRAEAPSNQAPEPEEDFAGIPKFWAA